MGVVVQVELMTGRYEAAGAGDRDMAEWPPHPARVFCALVAGARGDEDHRALRWLEAFPPPVVQAAGEAIAEARSGYVVTNVVTKGGGSQFHLGRGNALRSRRSAVPSSSAVRMVWPDADPEPTVLAALDGMARRVPYLGRSSGLAALVCRAGSRELLTPPAGLVSFEPMGAGEGGQPLRVPYPGYLDNLVEQHRTGRPPWEASRVAAYRRAGQSPTPPGSERPLPSVYTDTVFLRFTGVRPEGRLALAFTGALRRAVMALTPDPLPDALHGHGAEGRPHVAFLALPNVGHPHADGRLLGMAVAIPDLPGTELRTLVRAVLGGARQGEQGQRTLELNVPRVGSVDLVYEPGLVRPWGARPERWRRGSDRWVSVTPVVLDHYPRRGDLAAEIVRSCRTVGLPEPVTVKLSPSPLIAGGVRLRPSDLPEHLHGRLFSHLELRFSCRVAGPVLLGAGRYLGVGLMAPVEAAAVEEEAAWS